MKLSLAIMMMLSLSTAAARRVPDATLTEGRELNMDWGKLTVSGLAVSADGSKVAAVAAASPDAEKAAGRVVIFDFKTGKPETQFDTDERLMQVAFAKGGELITRGQSVRIWNLKTKQPTRTVSEKETGGPLRAMAISPDGKKLAIAAKCTRPVTLWDLAGGEGKALWEEKDAVEVESLSFDGKGEKLAAGGYLGSVARVYDLNSRKLVAELEDRRVRQMSDVVMSRDGNFLAACAPGATLNDDQQGLIFSVNTGKMSTTLVSMRSPVRPLGISPDGLTLLASNFSTVSANKPGLPSHFAIAVYMMYGGRLNANFVVGGPVSAAAFVDDEWIVAASLDRKGESKVMLYQLKFAPGFKATVEDFKLRWIDRFK